MLALARKLLGSQTKSFEQNHGVGNEGKGPAKGLRIEVTGREPNTPKEAREI